MKHRLLAWAVIALVSTSLAANAAAEQALPAVGEHAALAAMYASEARTLREKVAAHELMLKRYENAAVSAKGVPFPKATLAQHCRKLVAAYQQAASDADAMAKMERALADASPAAK